ncbi:hypothetical protein HYPSUDRAFT_135573 [Hypholoma sublateritium FD-334 SS-4]|uniref:N-acetyltransferase domain-containing protein n=1 Tax=Hypholoma sublateritium (strain FD-334 SS-4) TaxID=945553 RepID=A0A0D2LCF1_HYPSF|nr:hypothetical protein HYPSUDRAFT_135573 [Hypholoma sublateritium FD-334 SS-4]
MASPSERPKPHIRLAIPEDAEAIADVFGLAFSNDPVMNYLGNVKKVLDEQIDELKHKNTRQFYLFVVKGCFLVGGRITVVVVPDGPDANSGKIVAGCLWLPPSKRLSIWMIPTILRAGALGVIKRWGLRGLWRITVDYQGTTESKMEHAFRERGVKVPLSQTWYLQAVATHPDYQGQGIMSLMVREAFEHAPHAMYILEGTTAKSRDQYIHLGFENLTPIKFGAGKADAGGISASGEGAVGVEIWGMAKVRTCFFIAFHSRDHV